MAHLSQFSLVWNSHKTNISQGLSSLQQNGEFVDMTLAADGHLVKVHQIIIALASPYLKDLISTASCPHPVIFLNKISYSTLCFLLEYIYTGEVLISMDNLNELLEAGKELHIRGLEDMKVQESNSKTPDQFEDEIDENNTLEESCVQYHDIDDQNDPTHEEILEDEDMDTPETRNTARISYGEDDKTLVVSSVKSGSGDPNRSYDDPKYNVVQYTVSNQGSLQMILNRYVYYLKHSNKTNTRQWRCVDYLNNVKCPAHVFTRGDIVLKRISAHVHPFHDKKILKKVRAGVVFSAISEAQATSKTKKENDNPSE